MKNNHFKSLLLSCALICLALCSQSQIISTIAGSGNPGDYGLATSAALNSPNAVAVDGSGNVYTAEYSNHCIRRIDAITGIISTIAGTGVSGYSGDGGAATAAKLYNPCRVALDASDNIYIADRSNYRICKIAAATGIITTIAGAGTKGYSGDGGAATAAQLYYPTRVTVDVMGNVYIADYNSNRIRYICAASTLPSSFTASQQTLYTGSNSSFFFNSGCSALSTIKAAGSNSVAGPVNDSVWIEPAVPVNADGKPYVARHYGITPVNNASTATATITLFYTQADFSAYNGAPDHGADLPADGMDAANNKANLRIIKRSGTSSDGLGRFESYAGAVYHHYASFCGVEQHHEPMGSYF